MVNRNYRKYSERAGPAPIEYMPEEPFNFESAKGEVDRMRKEAFAKSAFLGLSLEDKLMALKAVGIRPDKERKT